MWRGKGGTIVSDRQLGPRGLPDAPDSLWKTLDATIVYRNPWMTVSEYRVRRPDGNDGIYGVVDPGDNVSIVALDAQACVTLVGQFAYPIQTFDWSIPSGRVDEGEDHLTAARRELAEEAGLEAARWNLLGSYYLSPGISTQISHIYLARELSEIPTQPEPTERITLRRMLLRTAADACLRGTIRSAPAVLGILRTWLMTDFSGSGT